MSDALRFKRAVVFAFSVRAETLSDLFSQTRKIEFESCKQLKTRSDSELSKGKWRKGIFLRTNFG